MTAEQEREAVVAWLRDLPNRATATERASRAFREVNATLLMLATAIERGDHLSRTPRQSAQMKDKSL